MVPGARRSSIRREGDGGNRPAAVVDRDGEPAADAEGSRLVEQLLLAAGEPVRSEPEARIRIIGLDTPELPPHHKCASEKEQGYAARDRLRALLKGATVAFCSDGLDRYGRTLAVVLADGRNVAEVLIGEGLAREYYGGRRQGWCE